MKRQRNIVNRFVDLEARVADEAEEEEEEDNDDIHGTFTDVIVHIPAHEFITEAFIEDQPVVDAHYVPPRRFSNTDEDSTERGWAGPVIARLQERYAQPRGRHSPAPLETPPADISIPEVGKWVRVQMGSYKGDVGYVESTDSSGVRLLLVPRILPPQPTQKRKRSPPRPTPKLFDPIAIKRVYRSEPISHAENIYTFNNCLFEHGLIIKTYDLHSISATVPSIPLSLFFLFRESGHPKVVASRTAFPRPFEREFSEGDEVYVRSSEKRGVITAVGPDSVEVDLVTGEGAVSVSWLDVRNVVSLGDFVEVTGGVYQGRTGWILGIINCVGDIVKDPDAQEPSLDNIEVGHILGMSIPLFSYLPQTFSVHIDLLKRISEPFSHGTHRPRSNDIPQYDEVPWLETNITIAKQGHPLRTRPGIIKDVLCRQATSSGLKVQVELTTLDAVAPFRRIVLDYDDVVVTRYVVLKQLKLLLTT